jgi:hypothetical protein
MENPPCIFLICTYWWVQCLSLLNFSSKWKANLEDFEDSKNNNFKFTIKFLMTLDRSYIGYLGFLGIDLFKSVLMYSNGDICLIKLLFEMVLYTVHVIGLIKQQGVATQWL